MKWFRTFLSVTTSLFIAFLGVLVLKWLHAPMPWLLGSILSMIIIGRFSSFPMASPKRLSAPSRAILGITIGSAFNPSTWHYLMDFIASLALVFPFVIVVAVAGMWYYMNVLKFDVYTAYFSSMPGGLLEMASLAESFPLDLYKVIITQASRLLFMMLLFPFLIEWISHIPLDGRKGITQPLAQTNLYDMIWVFALAMLGWRIAARFKISGGTIIIPMLFGAVAYSTGLIHSRPPTELINLIQLILGTTIGFAFAGVSSKEMLKVFGQTSGYFVILMAVCFLFVGLVAWLTNFPLLSIVLAFAPGGQAEMNLIAIVVGANLPYVALHHILRLFLVLGISPVLIRFLRKP